MAKLRRVGKGDKFRPRADDWNAFIDAAEYVRQRAQNLGEDGRDADPTTTAVRNASGYDVPQFGLVWIIGAPWRGMVSIARPAQPWIGNLAIAVAPIKKAGVGRVWTEGVHPVRIAGWADLQADDFPLMAISQVNSFDARAWTGTGQLPIWAKLDESPLVLADLSGGR